MRCASGQYDFDDLFYACLNRWLLERTRVRSCKAVLSWKMKADRGNRDGGKREKKESFDLCKDGLWLLVWISIDLSKRKQNNHIKKETAASLNLSG